MSLVKDHGPHWRQRRHLGVLVLEVYFKREHGKGADRNLGLSPKAIRIIFSKDIHTQSAPEKRRGIREVRSEETRGRTDTELQGGSSAFLTGFHAAQDQEL